MTMTKSFSCRKAYHKDKLGLTWNNLVRMNYILKYAYELASNPCHFQRINPNCRGYHPQKMGHILFYCLLHRRTYLIFHQYELFSSELSLWKHRSCLAAYGNFQCHNPNTGWLFHLQRKYYCLRNNWHNSWDNRTFLLGIWQKLIYENSNHFWCA